MKILLLSCSTGEGHNHCALAVKEALDARGHETSFLDMLHMFGDPGPLSFDKILNRISTKAPDVFGMMYHAGAMYSATGVTSPVYMANIRHARQLNAFIRDNGYDAVVCSHLFPMETLTFLRRWERCEVKCCGILSDYTCIPFLAETDLDAYFLPHSEVRELCIQAGMPAEKLIVSGMPVAARFLAPMDKAAARAAHADHFIRTQPGGYRMVVNEESSNVSQGQKQLLTIARAILADPRIMILDEATSSVDTRTEVRIQKGMDESMKGRTSFIIAHRLSTIRNADLILVMRDGDIVEQGTHEELMEKGGFYREIYQAQFSA